MNELFNRVVEVKEPSTWDLKNAFDFSPQSDASELWFKVKRKIKFFGSDLFFEVKHIVEDNFKNRNLINHYRNLKKDGVK